MDVVFVGVLFSMWVGWVYGDIGGTPCWVVGSAGQFRRFYLMMDGEELIFCLFLGFRPHLLPDEVSVCSLSFFRRISFLFCGVLGRFLVCTVYLDNFRMSLARLAPPLPRA